MSLPHDTHCHFEDKDKDRMLKRPNMCYVFERFKDIKYDTHRLEAEFRKKKPTLVLHQES